MCHMKDQTHRDRRKSCQLYVLHSTQYGCAPTFDLALYNLPETIQGVSAFKTTKPWASFLPTPFSLCSITIVGISTKGAILTKACTIHVFPFMW